MLFPAVHFSNLPQFPRAAADNISVLAQYLADTLEPLRERWRHLCKDGKGRLQETREFAKTDVFEGPNARYKASENMDPYGQEKCIEWMEKVKPEYLAERDGRKPIFVMDGDTKVSGRSWFSLYTDLWLISWATECFFHLWTLLLMYTIFGPR